MKGRKVPGFVLFSDIWSAPIFIVLAALFLCGAIAGSVTGLFAAYQLSDMVTSMNQTQIPTIWQGLQAAMGAAGWMFAVLLAGSMRLYGILICGILVVRGFVLAFSVAAFYGAWGIQGTLLSLCSSGIVAVIAIPCLLLCAGACFLAAQQGGKRYWYVLQKYRKVVLVCMVLSMWGNILRVPIAYLLQTWVL